MTSTRRFLTRVLTQHLRVGLQTGVIASAATAGALIAFGMGLDHPWLPFNLAAHVLLGSSSDAVNGLHPLVTPVGVLVHIGAILSWAVMFTLLTGPRRLWVVVASSLAFAAIVFALNTRIFPPALRPGYESVLSPAQMLFMHLVLAAALVIGTRIAFSGRG